MSVNDDKNIAVCNNMMSRLHCHTILTESLRCRPIIIIIIIYYAIRQPRHTTYTQTKYK